jgi:predicted MFS family arabinose efflux permease
MLTQKNETGCCNATRTFVLIIVGIAIVVSDVSGGFGSDEFVFVLVILCCCVGIIVVVIHQTQRPIDAIR